MSFFRFFAAVFFGISAVGCSSQQDPFNATQQYNQNGETPVGTIESLASAYLKNNNAEDARATLSQLPERAYTATTWLLLAEIYFSLGQDDLAESAFSTAMSYQGATNSRLNFSHLVDKMCNANGIERLMVYLERVANQSAYTALESENLQRIFDCLHETNQLVVLHQYIENWPYSGDNSLNLYRALIEALSGSTEAAAKSYEAYLQNRQSVSAQSLWQEIEITSAFDNDVSLATANQLIELFPDSQYAREAKALFTEARVNQPQQQLAPIEQPKPEILLHTMQRGETIYSLSKRYNTSVDTIIAANPDVDIYDIRIGQEIRIPDSL